MTVFASEKPTKDGRKYYFRVSYTVNGKRQFYESRKFKFKDDAKKQEALFLLEQNKRVSSATTFNELIDEYLIQQAEKVKPTTLANTRNCLAHTKKVLGNVRINKLTKEQWLSFRNYLKELPIHNKRRNQIILYTQTVIDYANRQYDIYTNVPAKFEKFKESADKSVEKKIEFWTPEQFQRFIAVVDDLMYKALFTLLYATGMRSGEALALQWKDVDFTNGYITINKNVTTKLKGHKFVVMTPKTQSSIRTIKTPEKALKRLMEYREMLKENPSFSSESFIFCLDAPIPNTTLQKRKNEYVKKAGVPNIRIHSLRHSTASALINSGATVTFISKFLGHSSTKETLDTYAHFFPNETDAMADRMNKLL